MSQVGFSERTAARAEAGDAPLGYQLVSGVAMITAMVGGLALFSASFWASMSSLGAYMADKSQPGFEHLDPADFEWALPMDDHWILSLGMAAGISLLALGPIFAIFRSIHASNKYGVDVY